EDDQLPEELFETSAPMPAARFAVDDDVVELEGPSAAQQAAIDDGLALPADTQLWPGQARRDADLEPDDQGEIDVALPQQEPAISHVAEEPAAYVGPPIVQTPRVAPPAAVAPPPKAPVHP